MDKKEFDLLSITEQVEFINEQLNKGDSLTNICKNIGIGRTTLRDRFTKAGYKFNAELKQYICNTDAKEYNCNTNILQTEIVEYKSNTNILNNKENKEKLINLINEYDTIRELIEWYHKQKNIVELPELKIDKSKLTGEIKTTTIRLYSNVWDKFKFFSEKYPEYKAMDLISMALIEFMEKYDK